ncbi:MAG: DNA replication/repair protein RecF [Candidatus Izimaplasma sp.]|nr:DNA replication/repair protein RecF [Candidatus Izimaplasma bacterium]
MQIKKLELTNFRNYEKLEAEFSNHTNIFIGKNAQGKTSILESLHILGLTKSHKVNKDRDVIKIGTEYAKINSLINLKGKDIELDIIISKIGKKAKYNQIELERLSEYIGILNVVIFAPEDLDLIKGNPQIRRKFLDLEIGQISKQYLYSLVNYKKVLKQRNDLLKAMQLNKNEDMMLLDIITDQLIGYLEEVVSQREEFINKINEYTNKIYKYLSNSEDNLQIKYLPSIKTNYKREFVNKYKYDIITGTTNIGAHRDDIEFYLNSNYIKTHSSQGEMRSSVLSVKLALIDFIYDYKKDYPILLLDDVLSELDEDRQNNLIDYIQNKTQNFITSTEINGINLKKINDYKLFTIENGYIKESDNNEWKL